MAKTVAKGNVQGKSRQSTAKNKSKADTGAGNPAFGTDVEPENYNAVVRDALLLNVVMNETHFKVEPEYIISDPVKRKFHYGRNMRHHLDSVSIFAKDEEGGAVGVDVIWEVRAKVGRKVGLKIFAAYTVLYTGLQGHSEDAIMLFLEKVAPVATYAYFRALVAQFNWAGEVDLPILPVYSSHH